MESLLELAVIAAAAWPVVRLCITAPFLRKLRSFPVIAAVLAGSIATGTAGLIFAAFSSPGLLRAVAAPAGAVLLWALWRARPAYGRARGLPPGSLGILPVGALVDDRFFLRQSERYGPVFKTSQFMRPMVCVVGLDRCHEFLRQYDAQLTPPALPFDRFVPGGFLRSMPAERHDRYAPLLRAALHGGADRNFEGTIAVAARAALNEMYGGSVKAGGQGIAPRSYLEEMLFALLLELFFGITPGSAAAAGVREPYRTIDVRNASGALRRQALPALVAISGIVRANRAGGAAPRSVLDGISDGQLDSEEGRVMLSNLIYILQNARNDTAGLLVWVLKMLGDHPSWWHRLQASSTGGDDGLAGRIVTETLRLEQSEFLFRRAEADLRYDGFLIPKGWLMRLCIRESHRAHEVFAQPDVFDPDRFLHRAHSRAEYSPFGSHMSSHVCLGEQITRTVGRIFLEELARSYRWRVVSDGPREFDGWHWKPSSRFRIDFSRASHFLASASPPHYSAAARNSARRLTVTVER